MLTAVEVLALAMVGGEVNEHVWKARLKRLRGVELHAQLISPLRAAVTTEQPNRLLAYLMPQMPDGGRLVLIG